MYTFVTTSGPTLGTHDKSAVRSQAMRHVRRRQRARDKPDSLSGVPQDAIAATKRSSHPPSMGITAASRTSVIIRRDDAKDLLCAMQISRECDDDLLANTQNVARKERLISKFSLCAESLTQDQAAIQHFSATIICLHSPGLERITAIASWVETMFPPSAWSSSIPVSAVGAWAAPRCRSHSYGNDAVGLLNLGCSKDDRRIIMAGRRYHLATIQTLRSDMAKQSLDTLGIFAASLDLMISSLYTVVSPGIDTWLHHLAGQTRLLKARIAEFQAPGFATFLFLHYRQLNLIRALVLRESMSSVIWKAGLHKPLPGSFESMYRLATKLPALLERADQMKCSKVGDDDESVRILVSFLQLERSLSDWLETWISLQVSRKPLASTMIAAKLPTAPHPVPCFEDGLVMALVWCILLLLHEGVYDLSGHLRSNIYTATRKASLDKANTYAMLLSQSVPYLMDQAGAPLSKALAVRAPLHFAARWYGRIGSVRQVEECRAHERSVRASAPHLDWDIALFWSFLSVKWLIDEKT